MNPNQDAVEGGLSPSHKAGNGGRTCCHLHPPHSHHLSVHLHEAVLGHFEYEFGSGAVVDCEVFGMQSDLERLGRRGWESLIDESRRVGGGLEGAYGLVESRSRSLGGWVED